MHCSQTLLLGNATTSWVICADEVMNLLICVSAYKWWMPEAGGADGTSHTSVQNLTSPWQKKKYSNWILPMLEKTIACLQSSTYPESLPAFMSHQCFYPAMRNRSPLFAPLHWQNATPISTGSNPQAETAILAQLLFFSLSLLSFSHFSVLQRESKIWLCAHLISAVTLSIKTCLLVLCVCYFK